MMFLRVMLVGLLFSGFTWAQEIGVENKELVAIQGELATTNIKTKTVRPDMKYEVSYRYQLFNFEAKNMEKSNYFLFPKNLDVQMHILALKYNINKKQVIEFGSTYLKNTVNLEGKFLQFKEKTEGLGDTIINYKYRHDISPSKYLKYQLGLSLPTGSIDKKENGKLISYNGQLGSGTYDFEPLIEYRATSNRWAFSNKLSYIKRTGENKHNYRLGNEIHNKAFIRYKANQNFYAFIKMNYINKEEAEIAVNPKNFGRPGKNHGGSKKPSSVQSPPSKANPVTNFNMNDPEGEAYFYFETVAAIKAVIPTGNFRYVRPTIELGSPIYTSQTDRGVALNRSWYIYSSLETRF